VGRTLAGTGRHRERYTHFPPTPDGKTRRIRDCRYATIRGSCRKRGGRTIAAVTDVFDDVLAANAKYAHEFSLAGLEAVAARGLGIVTCMDSRIEPLAMLGLRPGDAKILRNAGARVTDDVLRTLALATHLLGVDRVMVVPHTRCKMASMGEAEVRAEIRSRSGIDATSIDFGMIGDQRAVLRHDVNRVQRWPYLPPGVVVGGFLYNVDTGRLSQLC
jgi:carbonic anhydrase